MRRARNATRRPLGVIGEAAANLAARPGLSLLMVLSLATLLCTPFIAEHNETAAALNYANSLRAGGMFVLAVEAREGAALSVTDCLSLGKLDSVEESLALAGPVNAHLFSEAGPILPTWLASGSILRFVRAVAGPTSEIGAAADVLIDSRGPLWRIGRRRTVGIFWGNELERPLEESVVASASTYDLSALGPGFAGNALVRAFTGAPAARQCLVAAREDQRDSAELLVSATFPSTSGFSRRWVLDNAVRFESGRHRFEHRTSRMVWLFSLIVCLGLMAFYARLRRNDLTVYMVNGLGWRGALTLAGIELMLLWTAALTIAGVFTGLAVDRIQATGPPVAAGLRGLSVAAVSTVLSIPGVVLVIRPASAVDALKDR